MKKLISLSLAIVLILAFSITAYATQTGVAQGSYNANVTGTYVASATGSDKIFNVDISWSDMSFTYHAEQKPVWDTENHKYSESISAYWEGSGVITITNHSNVSIRAIPTYAKNTGYESASVAFSSNKLNIPTAAYYNQAVTRSITVTPTGSLPVMKESATIGSITVTIVENLDVIREDVEILYDKLGALWQEADNSGADETYPYEYMAVQDACTKLAEIICHYEYQDCCEDWNDGPCGECQEVFNYDYSNALTAYHTLKNLMGL